MVDAKDNAANAKQIYKSFFEEAFIANSNRPLSMEQCKQAFKSVLENHFSTDMERELEDFFYGAD